MLDKNDLEAIRSIMKEERVETEKNMESLMDKRFAESEKSTEALMDKRLAETEKSMESLMDKRLAETEKSMESLMDKRLAKTEKSMESLMDTKLAHSENLLLEELERTRNILEDRLNRMQDDFDELNQYYKITKLEDNNIALVLKLMDDLEKRVEELEKRTA